MPTQANANSPFLDERLEADLGVKRAPGQPTSAGKPGPQIQQDFSFPNPPSVNAAPAGRPPEGQAPQPGTVPGQPAAKPAAGGAPATAMPQAPTGGAQPQQGTQGLPPVPPARTQTTVGADGQARTTLTPEGDQKFREETMALRERMGAIPKVFSNPALPQMPVELGKWNYNPFTGTFEK